MAETTSSSSRTRTIVIAARKLARSNFTNGIPISSTATHAVQDARSENVPASLTSSPPRPDPASSPVYAPVRRPRVLQYRGMYVVQSACVGDEDKGEDEDEDEGDVESFNGDTALREVQGGGAQDKHITHHAPRAASKFRRLLGPRLAPTSTATWPAPSPIRLPALEMCARAALRRHPSLRAHMVSRSVLDSLL
ncbi:hypothetical protein L227DRAFT_617068 [Lentinus tigrinus ALCF2SS1-6]|uniref:Uncharacterized protein n=1 Tax=Lentinus tigrinus ALCF2SS1-6 TaxID=1328759 RepID=A0A5C2RPD6_9APHY|nr:hypothetical protein L227DRAFT_617068 [Lentinus tigrinus ALCF2SS1-6]